MSITAEAMLLNDKKYIIKNESNPAGGLVRWKHNKLMCPTPELKLHCSTAFKFTRQHTH
jgi:hypothetical protein